ncbi:unnamed protein product [Tuber melanosporum]|uniref:(Perigord truffle) hypothetical protein n=1 Tax=Tuber melanosporum (strain Mel28) TaxID=656061 RepID=D5GDE6_TUBMM|nr:uncharacterized protein GSTUM_00006174001 [Tuber melanosporum]CAZ82539.1 unnamed protein product [Tuber melanosporum]
MMKQESGRYDRWWCAVVIMGVQFRARVGLCVACGPICLQPCDGRDLYTHKQKKSPTTFAPNGWISRQHHQHRSRHPRQLSRSKESLISYVTTVND